MSLTVTDVRHCFLQHGTRSSTLLSSRTLIICLQTPGASPCNINPPHARARWQDNRLWTPDVQDVWRLSHVVSRDDAARTITVEPEGGGAQATVALADCCPFDPSHETDLDDASLLNNLHEAPLLNLVCSRFKRDKIYTNVGGVLISVNPYKVIPRLYTLKAPQGESSRTASVAADADEDASTTEGPHVYRIAQQALEAVESSKVRAVFFFSRGWCALASACLCDFSSSRHVW